MYIEREPDRNTFFIFYKLLGFSTNRVKIGANVKVLKKMKRLKTLRTSWPLEEKNWWESEGQQNDLTMMVWGNSQIHYFNDSFKKGVWFKAGIRFNTVNKINVEKVCVRRSDTSFCTFCISMNNHHMWIWLDNITSIGICWLTMFTLLMTCQAQNPVFFVLLW